MDFIVLFKYIIIGTAITICANQIGAIAKCKVDLQKYSLVFAFVISTITIFALNQGIFVTLNIPIEGKTHMVMFNYIDLFVTSLITSGGSQLLHKFIQRIIKSYQEIIGYKNIIENNGDNIKEDM